MALDLNLYVVGFNFSANGHRRSSTEGAVGHMRTIRVYNYWRARCYRVLAESPTPAMTLVALVIVRIMAVGFMRRFAESPTGESAQQTLGPGGVDPGAALPQARM
jgi:hypothetical protein